MNMRLPLNRVFSETILVVDDDAAVLKLLRLILEGAGFHVLAANSPREALHLEARFSGTIHLLLSDIMMPEMTGPVLAEVLHRRRPQIRVMMMSGHAADGPVPGPGWLQKPFLPAALLGRVTEVLQETQAS